MKVHIEYNVKKERGNENRIMGEGKRERGVKEGI